MVYEIFYTKFKKLKFLFTSIVCCLFLNPILQSWAGEQEDVSLVGYKKGFFIQSPDERFKLKIGGYIQGLFLGQILESQANQDTFRVRRARLKFSGHLYSKDIQYQLEYDFAGNKLLTTVIKLIHSKSLAATLGQFKVPFNPEGLSSASTLQFVDRSLAHSYFGISDEREIGLGVSGKFFGKKLEYSVAVLNGEGLNTLNQNNELRYAGRVVYNLKGQHGTKFSDTKHSEDPRVALGVGAMFNDTPDSAGTDEQKETSLTADVSGKYRGFGGYSGFFYRNVNPDAAASTHDKGWLAQIGYFVIPKTLEAAARVVRIYVDGAGDQSEYTGGLNYYIYGGHHVKLQLDYSVLTQGNGIAVGNDRVDHRARAQLQVKL